MTILVEISRKSKESCECGTLKAITGEDAVDTSKTSKESCKFPEIGKGESFNQWKQAKHRKSPVSRMCAGIELQDSSYGNEQNIESLVSAPARSGVDRQDDVEMNKTSKKSCERLACCAGLRVSEVEMNKTSKKSCEHSSAVLLTARLLAWKRTKYRRSLVKTSVTPAVAAADEWKRTKHRRSPVSLAAAAC